MNTKQQNKLAMYLPVKAVLDSNNSVWQSLQAFADGYTDFTSHVTRIQTLELSQVTDSTGIAQDKKASKARWQRQRRPSVRRFTPTLSKPRTTRWPTKRISPFPS